MSDTPDSPDLPQSDPLSGILSSPHKRRGFIARKTKAVRDRINQMLLDGFSYKDLISAIGEDGKDLNDDIVGRWQRGGYQDWLRDQQQVDAQRAKQEFAVDLVCEKDGSKITQSNLQVAAANFSKLLVTLDPTRLREALEDDPDKYIRLVNMLVRLSDGELRCEEHQIKHEQLLKGKQKPEEGGITDGAMSQAKDKLNLM